MSPLIGGRKDWVVSITRHVGRLVLSAFFHLKTNGAEYLPQNSAFVLLSKHQRWEDIPFLAFASPRFLYYIAKYELFRNPLSNLFLTSLGGIPLNRRRPLVSRHSLQTMIELLERGEGLVVFPEGTYYRNKVGPGHVGVVRHILSRLSPPFVPVGINYSRSGWRTLVRINFGRPFYADSEASASTFLDQMMKEIAQLSGLC